MKKHKFEVFKEEKIYTISDYSIFHLFAENRNVSTLRVDSMATDMSNGIDYSDEFPIKVIEDNKGELWIIDGQHRFSARKKLGKPVFFVISDKLTAKDILNINKNMRNIDYNGILKYHAVGSKLADYVKILNAEKKTGFKSRTLIRLSGKSFVNGKRTTLNNGHLVYTDDDMRYAVSVKKVYDVFKLQDNKAPERYIPLAIDKISKVHDISLTKLKNRFSKNIELFRRQPDQHAYYQHLVSLYNHGLSEINKVKIAV